MKFLTKIAILLVVVMLLSISTIFSIPAAAVQTPAPVWNVGNTWEYRSSCVQEYRGTVSHNYYSNQTMYYNVTDTETMVVENISYDVYTVASQTRGASQTYADTYTSYCDYWYNYTYYHSRTNYSIVKAISYINSTTVTYYTTGDVHTTRIWQYCVITYQPPFDSYQFPIYVGEKWNVTTTVHSIGYTTSQYDNNPPKTIPFDTYSTITYQYVCECTVFVGVPAGSFNTYRINQTYATAYSVTYTTTYYAPVAGNIAKMTIDQFGSQSGSSWTSHTVQELVAYSYTVVPELSLIPVVAVGAAVMFLMGRRTSAEKKRQWL